jgi:methylated-DNA-[protein]-cysteine S-methyltransferase
MIATMNQVLTGVGPLTLTLCPEDAGEGTCRLETPIGVLRLTADDESLTGIELPGERRRERREERGERSAKQKERKRSPSSLVPPPSSLLHEAAGQLRAYFDGKLREFDLPLSPAYGTDFQRHVWRELEGIPYGETISYAELARRIGRPGASRAVGAANGRNPLPIVVPCHRVIGADGTLTGYGGGLPIKRWLLEHEERAKR